MKTKSLKQAMGLLDRHLKPLGFERRGQVWLRGGGTVVAVIEFQRSAYSPALTVNYGLFLGEASAMIWPDVARSAASPDAARCAIRRRITQEHDGADLWFDMTNPMWADDVVGTVLGRVVPYLAPLEDPVAMVRELEGNRPPLPQDAAYRSFLLARHGQREQACRELTEAIVTVRSPLWAARLQEFAERLGCDVLQVRRSPESDAPTNDGVTTVP